MQLGRKTHLGVDHAVGRQVLGALGRDPDQRLPGLHHRHGVAEGLEVQLEPAALRGGRSHSARPAASSAGSRRYPPGGQLDDGLRAQPTVEVIVQQHFGSAADLLGGQRHTTIVT